MNDVRILVTGGTLDKIHDYQSEGLAFAPDGSTHLPEMLRSGRCYFPTVQVLMMKDSLDFTDEDRATIKQAVIDATETALVITHGTSTMAKTARFLKDAAPEKTIILTGAMRPFSLFVSDSEFNLGGALIAAQTLSPGVWGVMNGRVFAADKIVKNVEQGRFDL